MAAFQLILLDEAKKFLDNIPQNAHKKVLYNMWRVSGGEKNIELFKKLEKSEIWEFRTLYNGINSSLKFEIKAKQFYAASQRVL